MPRNPKRAPLASDIRLQDGLDRTAVKDRFPQVALPGDALSDQARRGFGPALGGIPDEISAPGTRGVAA
ncbi:MAG: hypothetical protein WB816_13035 [Methylocystis sp.]